MTWVPPGVTTDPLALRELYADHVAGAFIPRGKAKAVHMLVLFPASVPTATRADAEAALQLAVDFVQERFGGNAVFSARMDRDEKSLTNCDLFIAPRYLKKTKRQAKEAISLSRHMKQIAERRGALTDDHNVLRGQGQALQDEFAEFLRGRGYQAIRGQKKLTLKPDWVSPEAYGVTVDRQISAADRQVAAEDRSEIQGRLADKEADLDTKAAAIVAGLEEATRVGREIQESLIEGGRQFVTEAWTKAEDIKRQASIDAEKVIALARQEAATTSDKARMEADNMIAAARREAETIVARIKRRLETVRRLGRIMVASFNSRVEKQIPKAIAEREAAAAKAEAAANERIAQARRAEQQADDRQAALKMAETAVRTDSAQLALLARSLGDPSLALTSTTDERGFEMADAAMTDTERSAYRAQWSANLTMVADRILGGIRGFRIRNAKAADALQAREVGVFEREQFLVERLSALETDVRKIDIAKKAAAEFNAAYESIPELERKPPVREAIHKAGILAQAANLNYEPASLKSASKGSSATGAIVDGRDDGHSR